MYRLGTTLRLPRAGYPLLVVGAALLAAPLALLAPAGPAQANGTPIRITLRYMPGLSNFGPQNATGVAELITSEGEVRLTWVPRAAKPICGREPTHTSALSSALAATSGFKTRSLKLPSSKPTCKSSSAWGSDQSPGGSERARRRRLWRQRFHQSPRARHECRQRRAGGWLAAQSGLSVPVAEGRRNAAATLGQQSPQLK